MPKFDPAKPDSGITAMHTYSNLCTAAAARSCAAGMCTGAGGLFRSRHHTRSVISISAINPNDLCRP
ncbi:hypothetical protein AYR66_14500 [Noviherbaspirillum denitrificans]|uniref:Uncharacterized protein n=1 Tax=Noviherbaspirillum denitrificans TaxID=1968433 RepID=A0A254TLC4_9BURK|nr:hypothetical protein AYR66_14500 [Noviherbaspirillum denitrificans]